MDKKLHILHAGSISSLLKSATEKYRKIYPKWNISLSSNGSVQCIRQLKGGYKADLVVLADYSLFESLMYPDLTNWHLIFASNRLVLAGKPDNLDIKGHWLDLISPQKVRFGHTDPCKDPCGYRTLMAWQLAERFRPGLNEMLLRHPGRVVFSDAKTMIKGLLENQVDYIFEYASVAEEKMLSYLELEKDINLSDPAREALYKTASVIIDETKDQYVQGLPIAYGLTIPFNSPNYEAALNFIQLMLTIDLKEFGLKSSLTASGKVPEELMQYL